MQRRSFLGGILSTGMAPAFVKAGILMPVKKIIIPNYSSNWVVNDDMRIYCTRVLEIKKSTVVWTSDEDVLQSLDSFKFSFNSRNTLVSKGVYYAK